MKTVGNSSILNTPENIEIIKCDVLQFIDSQRLISLLPDSRCIPNDGFSINDSTKTAPVVDSDAPMRETPTPESTIIASFNTPDNTLFHTLTQKKKRKSSSLKEKTLAYTIIKIGSKEIYNKKILMRGSRKQLK